MIKAHLLPKQFKKKSMKFDINRSAAYMHQMIFNSLSATRIFLLFTILELIINLTSLLI